MTDNGPTEVDRRLAAEALFRERVTDAIKDFWHSYGAPEDDLPQIIAMLVLMAKFGIKVHNWVLLGSIIVLSMTAFAGIVVWTFLKNLFVNSG